MPSNLTWPEARVLAKAGTPVRRDPWLDPIKWITHTTGIYWYHEELNQNLQSPASADPVRHVVRATEFGTDEFLAVDWTTLEPGAIDPPPASAPPTPPAPPVAPVPTPPGVPPPPGSGGGGGYPPNFPGTTPAPNPPPIIITGGGGGGQSPGTPPKIPDVKPVAPPPLQVMPTASVFADVGTASVAATMIAIPAGTAWSGTALVVGQGLLYNLGTFTVADDAHSAAASAMLVGHDVVFTFKCLTGSQTLTSNTFSAHCTSTT